MACYYLVISSTHLSNGHFRRVKGVFRGPLCPGTSDSPEHAERAVGCSVEDLKALYYCELCDKQYLRHQEFDNHINSYDHAHKQRLKELKQREFARNVASKTWKDQRKQEKALRRLHQQAQLQQETHRVSGRSCGVRSAVRVVNKQQSREMEQRDLSPEDKPFKLKDAPSAAQALSYCQKDSCGSPNQLSDSRESNTSTFSAPHNGNPQSHQRSHAQRGRVGGRLGVSFCFSRKGPRLEPSASVFSDHEEEEREKREQIRERIKKIIKDIDREMEESNHGRKYSECKLIEDSVAAPMSMEDVKKDGNSIFVRSEFDSEEERKAEARTHDESVCVLGKDGATQLSWPVSLLKFTKSEPHISYSCNPKQPQQTTERQEGKHDLFGASSDEHVSDTLQEEIEHGLETNRRGRTEEDTKVGGDMDEKTEAHLFPENKTLSSPDRERCMPGMDERAVSHSFVRSDRSDTNNWCPQEERLRGARGIRESASTAMSSKLEPVTPASTQSVCIRLSGCDCESEAAGESAIAPKILRCDSEMPCFQSKMKTNKPGKKKRGKRDNASNKKQSSRYKLRSVVTTVSTPRDKKVFVNRKTSNTGGRRRQNERSSYLLGRIVAKPLSVSVRKRGPHRSLISGSAPEHSSVYPPLNRQPTDRDIQRKRDRDAVTFPWLADNSIHAFTPARSKKLFWEKGHHSNPRSFIDCSYPDNSCNGSPTRKRKILHRESSRSKRSSLRCCEFAEELNCLKRSRGQTGSRGRSFVSEREHSEWMRGNSLSSTEAEDSWSKADWASRHSYWVSSPCPSRRYRSDRTPEDIEWDGCSLDRWTWGSIDSWEDRDAQGRKTGPQGESDRSDSLSWKGSDNRQSRYQHSPSPEWWMRHTDNTEDNVCHSPRSYSPMSSTSMSELSWEWSRSSTCSGHTVNRKTSKPNRIYPGTPEQLPVEAKRQSKPAPASLSCSSFKDFSQHRYLLESSVPVKCEGSSPAQHRVNDVSPAAPVSIIASSELNQSNTVPQKTTKTLPLPLIGKRPAIQKKERKRRKILEKSEEKLSGDNSTAVVGDQKCLQVDSNRANSCPVEIKAADRQTRKEAAEPISFSVEEIDKYRQLQEEARKHMQKVLEQTQESAHKDITHSTTTDTYRTPADTFASVNPQTHAHIDTMQAGLMHQACIPNVSQQDNKTVLPVSLSSTLSNLHHIILHSSHSCSPPPVAHPPQLSHSLPPIHPSLTHYLHLSPLSISSLLPSVFLSQHPIHLLRPCPAFTPLDPFSAVAMPPLNPQPFMDRAWPVRFQQKAL